MPQSTVDGLSTGAHQPPVFASWCYLAANKEKVEGEPEENPPGPPKPASLSKALLRLGSGSVVWLVVLSALAGLLPFAGPFFLELIIAYLTPNDDVRVAWKGMGCL